MNKIHLSIIGSLFLFVNVIFASEVTIVNNQIKLNFSDQSTQNETDKSNIKKIVEVPGLPMLPYYSFLVEGRPSEFEVKLNIVSSFELKNLEIKPAQPKPCRCNKIESLKYTINQAIYNGNRFWPQKNYEVTYLGDIQGKSISRITIYPNRYNPILKVVQNIKSADFTINSKNDKNSVHIYDKYDDLLEIKNKKYLILTLNKFNNALTKFITWKRKLGFSVDVINVENIGTEPNKIKAYLKNRYENENTKFSFLLIVGHEDSIPPFYQVTTYDRNTPTDLPYTLYGDENDFIPDVYYGRMTVDNEEDILHQTEKIINYEKGAFSLTNFVTNAVGIASNEGSQPSDVDYILNIEKPFKENRQTNFTNFFQGKEDSTIKNINNEFTRGISWLTYIGHGSGFSWPSLSETEYDIQKIKEMKFSLLNPIIIDVACQNGRFKYGSFLGERMMNEVNEEGKPIGAVAYYGGSVDISWDPPAIMATGITKSYFEKNLKYLGQTLLAGQLFLINNYNSLRSAKENLVWYHLQGDPSLQIRTKNPLKLKVTKIGNKFKITDSFNQPTGTLNVTFSDDNFESFSSTQSKTSEIGEELVEIPGNADQIFINSANTEFYEKNLNETEDESDAN